MPKHQPSQGNPSTGVITLEQQKTSKPKRFAVIMINDDFTPMEFVTFLLIKLFNKGQEESIQLMLKIHNEGQAIIGIYAFSVAETLVDEATQLAKTNEYPLRTFYEPHAGEDED